MGLGWLQCLGITIGSTVGFYGNSSLAQITPDQTLPTNSSVRLEGNRITITDGTQAGSNLFHSFKNFSVPTGSEAFFNNNPDIKNIINRVTGGSISNIDGLIRANGSANLFLINPNGIIFGPNARLNIGGSFYGTSANSMKFADGSEFSATNPQSTPLLTIDLPLGLQYGRNPGNITVNNQGQGEPAGESPTLLEVPTGKTLALVGGDTNINGKRLRAAGGRIELGGLASEGTVGINNDGSLTFPDGVERANVSLNGGELDVTAGGGGSIAINARNINLRGGGICAGIGADDFCGGLASNTTGSVVSQAGDITLNATGDITGDGVVINNQVNTGVIGNAGNINIQVRSFSMTNGAQISASTFGEGNAGSVTINASDLVKFDGEDQDGFSSGAFSTVEPGVVGDAGGISITTGSLEVTNGALLSADTFGQGNAGSVTINANDLVNFDGVSDDRSPSGAFSTVGSDAVGDAGGVSITTGSLEITNGALLSAATFGQGDAGGVSITTGTLEVKDGARILARNNGGRGNAGTIAIKAEDRVTIAGFEKNRGAIVGTDVASSGIGNGNDLNIKARSIYIKDDAIVAASIINGKGENGTLAQSGDVNIEATQTVSISNNSVVFSEVGRNSVGNGGTINISAPRVFLERGSVNTQIREGGNTQIREGDEANAGDINISATELLQVTGGGQLATSSGGRGNAGRINISASKNVIFDGVGDNRWAFDREGLDENRSGAFSQVNRNGVGNAGDVSINTESLKVSNGAQLSASSFGQGNAGNLNIKAKSIRLDRNGTIATDTRNFSEDSQANINILRSQDLILRRGSNITANAIGDSGNITINTGVLAGFEDSNITANSTDARGGNIVINAEGIFGMQFRDELSSLSDITATGANNELSGNVEINKYDSEPTGDLAEVLLNSFDASNQIYDPCTPGGRGFVNSFVSIGRGGLPMTPTEPLQDTSTISTWVKLKPQTPSRKNRKTSSQPITASKTPKVEKPTRIVEATGWIVDEDGNIEFVAQANHTNPKSPWQNSPSCSVSQ